VPLYTVRDVRKSTGGRGSRNAVVNLATISKEYGQMMNLESPNGNFCSYNPGYAGKTTDSAVRNACVEHLSEVLEKLKDWKRDMWETRDAAATGFPRN